MHLALSLGADAFFAETDVVVKADPFEFLRSRPQVAAVSCAAPNVEPGVMRGVNSGVFFFRSDARVRSAVAEVVATMVGKVAHGLSGDEQAEIHAALVRVGGGVSFYECLDSSLGFTTFCCDFAPNATYTVHAAGPVDSQAKVRVLRDLGLWLYAGDEQPSN